MKVTIKQLAEKIGAELTGAGNEMVESVMTIEAASDNQVTFAKGNKHLKKLAMSKAAAVIIDKQVENLEMTQLVVKDVDRALIAALGIFAPDETKMIAKVDETAVIADDVEIDGTCYVGPQVVIETGCKIGENVTISAGCKIGQNVTIAANTKIDSNVVIYRNCEIGKNVVVQANTTIGSVGFGYSFINGAHQLIPHNGNVIIEDFVEIGANCCVDRAKFGATVIGAGTKLDNLVHVAHNVVIGKCCAIAGQVGVAGSAVLGDGVIIGGQAAIRDNVTVGSGVLIAGKTGVGHDVEPGQQISGYVAMPHKQSLKVMILTAKLPKIVKQLRSLAKTVKQLKKNKQ